MKIVLRFVVFSLVLILMSTVLLANGELIVYSNFAVVQSNISQRNNGLLILPTTNSAVQDSLVTSSPVNWYRYHKGERYSLDTFLDSYVGKVLKFKFQDGTIKNLKLISTNPEILQDTQNGMVYLSPAGEYIFPSLVSLDTRNYFAVSTNATTLLYHYISTNIGWKAVYDLNISSSKINGKILLWNKTDTTFKDFHLLMVAGKQFENFQNHYSKALAAAPKMALEERLNVESSQGYKVYDFGQVKSLREDSTVFLSLFSKKVDVEKINVAYDPSNNFAKAVQAVKIKHDFPMPQGVMSLYSDYNGVSYYLGQSSIPDSPASSTLEVPYGENFDLEVRAVKVRHLAISKNTFIDKYEVDVKNFSDRDQGIWIYKYVPQSSQITSGNLKIERIAANRIRFYMKVKAHSEGKFEYTLQTSY
ncbi:hypothetical protein [Mesoaciditoga lauensis]|uniref:hypothetical protein n=1 Tax=Mesoaciditoga lauensis TaxID=1495039 RepID=UPI00055B83F2|nr:hypothetical protein [Mesoaciditoga lauensis]